MAYISNQTAGNQILQWNYLASFQLQPTNLFVDIINFKMKPYYPVYDQFSPNPASYFIIYNSTRLEILDLNGTIVSSYTDIVNSFISVTGLSEQRAVITGGENGQVRLWNFTIGQPLNNTYNFSEFHSSKVEFLERVKNARKFLSADNTEKKLRIWSLDNMNLTSSVDVSFGQDLIIGVKSISNKTAVIYGNGFSLDYIDIETGGLITTITLENITIAAVEILPLTFDTKQERIAVLASDGLVRVYVLSQSYGVESVHVLFMPLFPQINKIIFALTFKKRNIDNTATSIMAIVSDKYNKTVFFINEYTRKNVSSGSFDSEIKGLYQIMGRYMPVFQDMLLVWYGNSFSLFSIDDDGTIYENYTYTMGVNKTIVTLGIVYQVIQYSYAFVSIIDQNNIVSLIDITGINVTYYKENNPIKFFCAQNFFSNFAYALPDDTIMIHSIDQNSFSVSSFQLAKTITHLNMTACFSKNIVGGGYYMTSNQTATITWMYDGTLLFNMNFTNITSLLIEGNPLFTAVNSHDDNVYEAVTGLGSFNNYSVGFAPNKNGFMFQFLEYYFYAMNERELAQYYMDCPFGSTQSNSIYGACYPNCNNSFISLTNSSCAASCLYGTYPTPIIDTYNNFTAKLCQNFNSTILNCQFGQLGANNVPRCTKCDSNYFLLATNTLDSPTKWNSCAFKGLDGRLGALSNSPKDGTGNI